MSDLVGNPEDRFSYDAAHMSRAVRTPISGVSDQVRHKTGCTTTEDGWGLELSDRGSRRILLLCEKTKALISCAVTLIFAFVFAYVKRRFSHDAAHIMSADYLYRSPAMPGKKKRCGILSVLLYSDI